MDAKSFKTASAALYSASLVHLWGPGWRGLGSSWALFPGDVTLSHGFISHVHAGAAQTSRPAWQLTWHPHLGIRQAGQA